MANEPNQIDDSMNFLWRPVDGGQRGPTLFDLEMEKADSPQEALARIDALVDRGLEIDNGRPHSYGVEEPVETKNLMTRLGQKFGPEIISGLKDRGITQDFNECLTGMIPLSTVMPDGSKVLQTPEAIAETAQAYLNAGVKPQSKSDEALQLAKDLSIEVAGAPDVSRAEIGAIVDGLSATGITNFADRDRTYMMTPAETLTLRGGAEGRVMDVVTEATRTDFDRLPKYTHESSVAFIQDKLPGETPVMGSAVHILQPDEFEAFMGEQVRRGLDLNALIKEGGPSAYHQISSDAGDLRRRQTLFQQNIKKLSDFGGQRLPEDQEVAASHAYARKVAQKDYAENGNVSDEILAYFEKTNGAVQSNRANELSSKCLFGEMKTADPERKIQLKAFEKSVKMDPDAFSESRSKAREVALKDGIFFDKKIRQEMMVAHAVGKLINAKEAAEVEKNRQDILEAATQDGAVQPELLKKNLGAMIRTAAEGIDTTDLSPEKRAEFLAAGMHVSPNRIDQASVGTLARVADIVGHHVDSKPGVYVSKQTVEDRITMKTAKAVISKDLPALTKDRQVEADGAR